MTAKLRLSLCMIVRDEEKWIEQCLNSVRHVVDEMIVVDTGSVDATPTLAARLGAKVYDYPWNDHFAEARNFSLKQASGKWILWMDADECLDASHHEAIDRLVHSDKWLASVPIINYYGDYPAHPHRSYRILQFRLFRNSPKIRFQNAIHEQLVRIPEFSESTVDQLPTVIHHYGYMNSPVQAKQKSQRNLLLLKKSMEHQQDYDPWLDYHLASELYRLGRLKEALASLNRAILRFLEKEKLPPSILYRLKYTILIELGLYEQSAASIEAALKLYPDYVDLHLFKGIILHQLKRYEEALLSFQHCLQLGDHNLIHLTSYGAGSFLAWYYMGCCYQQLNKHEQARTAFSKALDLAPDFNEALTQLVRCREKEVSSCPNQPSPILPQRLP